MIKQKLHDGWMVRAVGDLSAVPTEVRGVSVPASVPSTVHTALLRAGKIVDPYADLNEHKVQWIGLTDWEYRLEFEADEALFKHERIDLCFDGLDTVARIEVNGVPVGRAGQAPRQNGEATTENMHRRYRFDVRGMLKRGRNELVITFASAVKYALAMREKLGARPYCNGVAGPFNSIRKMACNFGWDWGPGLVTCGIWKSVRLEGWSVARLIGTTITTQSISDHYAVVRAEYFLERSRDDREIAGFWTFTDSSGKQLAHGTRDQQPSSTADHVVMDFTIPKPERWWPAGGGNRPLYMAHLELTHMDASTHADEDELERVDVPFGLRTVELDTSPDDIGRKFVVKINGKPIFCKGFNWIPDDCFIDRAIDPQRVRARIQQAVDAGANMLRVWGGGIYETDEFYEICDEMGVMVWQDFPFACAMYAEEEPIRTEVEAEVRDNVARLAHHPSLVIWNGNNENLWAYRDWGWKEQVAGKTWGTGYYFDLIPKILKELDPSRPYWAGSPWSGDYDVDNGVHPNAATHGNKHVWEAWFKEDYAVYRKFEPRFCSEFGFQAPATYASIASVVPASERDFGSAAMRHRQKSGDQARDDGDQRNLRHLVRHFNLPGVQELLDSLASPRKGGVVPECGCEPLHAAAYKTDVDFDHLHYLLQLNQARALTLGVEWFRSRMPTCMGTLYWQLNDCWPGVTSWSCVDGDGRKKPLWYATRRFYAPRLLTIQPAGEGLELCSVNETDRAMGKVMVTRQTFGGEVLAREVVEVNAPRVKLSRAISTANDSSREMIVAQGELRALWFFDEDRNLEYPAPEFDAEISVVDGKQVLSVTAKSLIRDLCLFVDRLDPKAEIDEQVVTLLPGERVEFAISSQRSFRLEELIERPVMQCANWYGKK